jgi:hypothetical protein
MKKPNKKNTAKYFKDLEQAEELFYADISRIEKQMREEFGIEDIEFFAEETGSIVVES